MGATCQLRGPVRPPATIPTPAAYQEAMGSPDRGEWKAAMDKEMLSISEHDVADLVPSESLPPGAKPIGSRWHFKSKATGDMKARLIIIILFAIRQLQVIPQIFYSTS